MPETAPRLAPLEIETTPSLIVVPPLYVFAPARVNVSAPTFFMASVPWPSSKMPWKVLSVASLPTVRVAALPAAEFSTVPLPASDLAELLKPARSRMQPPWTITVE